MKTLGWQSRLSDAKRELLGSRDVVVLNRENGGSTLVEKLASEKTDKGERRTFEMLAYTGVEISRWYGRLVIDLKGIESDGRVAILYEHNDLKPVGVATEKATTEKGLVLRGHLLSNEAAREIASNSDDGLPYRCSVGLRTTRTEELAEGGEAQVNGRTVKGPCTIARASRLFECSFITCDPADPNTVAEVMHREGSMAELETAPKSNEILKAEAAKAAKEELKTRAAELVKAFPGREAFGQACALEGLSLVEAKARLSEVLGEELKAAKESQAKATKTHTEEEALRLKLGGSEKITEGPDRSKAPAEAVENLSADERAKHEWHRNKLVRAGFPDVPAIGTGVEIYASYLRLEDRLRAPASQGFGGWEKNQHALQIARDKLIQNGGGERLTSWGRSGPDYADYTVKGFLGMLYKPLENVLGGSWANRVGVLIPSNQETETYRFFGQVPQFREWLGSRQINVLKKFNFQITNKTFELTLGVAIPDFIFEKSGQLAIRFGETGRRAGQHWEKLVSALRTANGTAYDGQNFYDTDHALYTGQTAMSNALTKTDYSQLDVATAADPTPAEMMAAIVAVTSHFYKFVDDRDEPTNGDAKQFLVTVPTNMWASAVAALRLNRLNSTDNMAKAQDVMWDVVPDPRLNSAPTVFYVDRVDSLFKPFVLQEATGVESEFQGAGSSTAFEQDAYAFGLKCRRNAGYGEWQHSIKATLG